jgi:hypothetical protein
MPVRIQLSRKKGFHLPPDTVNVARPGRWGNPYRVSSWMTLDLSLRLFEETLRGLWSPSNVEHLTDEQVDKVYAAHSAWRKRQFHHPLESARVELRGKNVACWCKLDAPCHADVLLRIAND